MKRKQQIRENFRNAVFERDGHKCRMCGRSSEKLDAHHIQDRTEMPNGGYVKENGITLCPECHMDAERFHISAGREWVHTMHPDDLYRKIESSHEVAIKASEKLA